MDYTLVLCKPDAVRRRLVGTIIARLEAKGLTIAAAQMLTIGPELAARHYAEHVEKPFYPELADFIGSGPSVALVVGGPEETPAVVRTMMGATHPKDSAPGTIRGDFGLTLTENLIHGSDSLSSAQREIGVFFPGFSAA